MGREPRHVGMLSSQQIASESKGVDAETAGFLVFPPDQCHPGPGQQQVVGRQGRMLNIAITKVQFLRQMAIEAMQEQRFLLRVSRRGSFTDGAAGHQWFQGGEGPLRWFV